MKRNQLISKDLRTLSVLLSKWDKYVKNANDLAGINIKEINKKQIQYEISRSKPIIFSNIDIGRHSVPAGVEKLPKKEKSTEIKLTTTCIEKKIVSDNQDPIDKLGVNINIELSFLKNDEIVEHKCSWHLDRSMISKSEFCHPLYHFSFGGDLMTKGQENFGNLLLMTSPRIIHPPLDIILAIDFIIKNFYKIENHNKLTSLPAYKSILKNAKKKYWKSYSSTFVSEWYNGMGDSELSHQILLGYS